MLDLRQLANTRTFNFHKSGLHTLFQGIHHYITPNKPSNYNSSVFHFYPPKCRNCFKINFSPSFIKQFILHWSIADWQCCGSFQVDSKRGFKYTYTSIPSHPNSVPIQKNRILVSKSFYDKVELCLFSMINFRKVKVSEFKNRLFVNLYITKCIIYH